MNARDLKKSPRLRAGGGARSALLVGVLFALSSSVSFVDFARNHSDSTISATSGQQKDTWPPKEAVLAYLDGQTIAQSAEKESRASTDRRTRALDSARRLAGELDQGLEHARRLLGPEDQIVMASLRHLLEPRDAVGLDGHPPARREV